MTIIVKDKLNFAPTFEESRRDVHIEATGRVRCYAEISPSFAILALDLLPEEESVVDFGLFFENPNSGDPSTQNRKILDILLTKKDGWDSSTIREILEETRSCDQNGTEKMTIAGYPELRKEIMTVGPCTKNVICCIHALKIDLIRDDNGLASKKVYEANEIYNENNNSSTTDKARPTPSQDTAKAISSEASAVETTEKYRISTKKKKNNTDRGANDGSRFAKLVAFLLWEFGGYDNLRDVKKPVLDIAGGAGGLAFELSVRHRIPVTVVDTKQVKYTNSQLKHLEFRQQSYNELNKIPEDKTTPLVESLKHRFQCNHTKLLQQLQTLLDTNTVLEYDPKGDSNSHHSADDQHQKKLCELLHKRKCSVLVGLHPDQALDPIIDVGFALQLSWVVAPCCVFPNLFQQRRLPNGQAVRNYEQLCEWILNKHPDVKEIQLPFRGRNRIFYWHAPGKTAAVGSAS